jgi:hypothetical protein
MNHKNTLTALTVAALAALIMVCFLAAPANSSLADKSVSKVQHDFWMNNLTKEELDNMTVGQLQEMRQQAWQNATPCQIGRPGQKGIGCCGRGCMARDSLILLMDDLTVDKLNNMTLSQIRELEQKKIEERNNMTLGQIRELEQKKMEERNNMTLGELREEAKEQRQIAALLGSGAFRGGIPAYDARGSAQGCCRGAP